MKGKILVIGGAEDKNGNTDPFQTSAFCSVL
jgi:hypothetical protein